MNRERDDAAKFTNALRPIFHELDDDLIKSASIRFRLGVRELLPPILPPLRIAKSMKNKLANFLLKSDVCFAGKGTA